MSPRIRTSLSAAAVLFPAVLAALAACAPHDSDANAVGAGGSAGDPTSNGGDPDPCALHGAGCPCSATGLVQSCGTVESRSGNYVTCAPGIQTCGADETWGACIAEGTAQKHKSVVVATGGARPDSLSPTPTPNCQYNANTCDPSCVSYNDTPAGITDAGPGLTVVDAGLTLGANDAGATLCTGLAPLSEQNVVITSINPPVAVPPTVLFATSLLPPSCAPSATTPTWGVSRYDLALISAAGTYQQLIPAPGDVTVSAYIGSLTASATVHVTLNVVDVLSGPAPLGYSGASFTGAVTSTEAAPSVLYPYDQVKFPLDLSAPIVMWKRGGSTAAKAVRIGLRYPAGATSPTFLYSAIVPESATPAFQIPQTAWAVFDQTSAGSQGQIEIQRIDGAGNLQAPVVVRTNFVTANLRGRVIYTQYAGTGSGIEEVLPYGSAAPTALNGASNCGVCHSVSADGTKLSSSSWNTGGSEGANTYAMSNISAAGALTPLGGGPNTSDGFGPAFAALTRTGSYGVLLDWWGNVNGGTSATTPGTAGPNFKIYKYPTAPGSATDVSDTGFGGAGNAWGLGNAQMYVPTFSPDNTRLLFVSADTTAGAASRQGIGYWQFDETNKKFSGRTQSMKSTASGNPAGQYVRWPSWEIDSRSVLFQAAPATTTEDEGFAFNSGMDATGYTGRSIKLHGQMYSMDTGAVGGSANAPVSLANINRGLGNPSPIGTDDTNRSYQPTMLGVTAGGSRWAVFTSLRAYGNKVNTSTATITNPSANNDFTAKLWVSAIDDATSGTTDRSHPPFLLPNQDLSTATSNERGFWSVDACTPAGTTSASACTSNDQCCGFASTPSAASCQVQVPLTSPAQFLCTSLTSTTCIASGAACSSSAQCCGYPNGPLCISGQCQTPPPVPTYSGATFTRDYSATCPTGQVVGWHKFYWQTQFPTSPGASIVFGVATASTEAALPSMAQAPLGTQTATNTMPLGTDVSAALLGAAPPITPSSWIRVFMTFAPSSDGSGRPVLTNWNQEFDCLANQ